MRFGQRSREGGDPVGGRQLSARTLQIFGLLLIAGAAVFWGFTQRESALLVGTGVTLSTLGWIQRVINRAEDRLPRYARPELTDEERDQVRRARRDE